MRIIRIAAIVFLNKRLLAVKHTKPSNEYWVLPGGRLEHGESISECAVRELEEECGIHVSVTKILGAGVLSKKKKKTSLDIVVHCDCAPDSPPPRLGSDPEAGKDKVLTGLGLIHRDEFHSLTFYPPPVKKVIADHWTGIYAMNGLLFGRYS